MFEIIRFFIYGHKTNNESANANPGMNYQNEIPVANPVGNIKIPTEGKISLDKSVYYTPTEK